MLNFSGDNVGGDGRVGYMSQTSHSYSLRGDSRVGGVRHVSRSEYIKHSSLFNVEESVGGVGRSGSRYCISSSPSNSSGDHGKSSGFYSYGDNRNGHSYHTRSFSSYNHGGLNISYPSFPQEYIPGGVHVENLHQNNPYRYYPIIPTH